MLGGAGFYGQYVVRDLLRTTEAQIVVAARSPARVSEKRVSVASVDLEDIDRLRRLALGSDVIVHCAGPFTRLPLAPVDVAVDLGIPYIDIAEDRAFARALRTRHGDALSAGVPLLNGMSVSPAMEALATRHLGYQLETLTALRTYAAPDTRRHRGPAMFETMLFGAGKRFDDPNANHGLPTYGWTEPEWFDLPAPVGRRLTFRIHDMADVDLLPAAFGLDYVAFKAGSEWAMLNALVGLAAQVRRRTGHPDWTRFTRAARALSRVVGRFGREEGGVAFELAGTNGGRAAAASLALTAERHGGQIPSLLASMAVGEVLSGRYSSAGVADVGGWIDPDRWIDGMASRGLRVWHRGDRSSPWVQRPFA